MEEENEEEAGPSNSAARQARDRKRKRQAEAIEKIKKTKAFKRRKRFNDDSEQDDDDLALTMFNEDGPVPGQIENCAECEKRFTVTAYTRAGPKGGLLCPKCGKKLSDEEKAAKKNDKKKKAAPRTAGRGRRKIQSQLLDGHVGTKSLITLCVDTLVNNIELADDFGDLPAHSIDRIARQLSKRRLLTPQSLKLFLQPKAEDICLYDAARLGLDDFLQILQICSNLKNLKLRNAIQFKDEAMEYLTGRHIALENLYLSGASLVSEACWKKYLKAKGKSLKGLRVYYTDKHLNDNIVEYLPQHCPSLTHLKICHNQEVSDNGIEHIAHLSELQHLSLQLMQKTSTESYVKVIKAIGKQLRTFSIRNVSHVDDRLLDAIHEHCTSLTKLRITHSEYMTDAGFARLFNNWKNKPLTFIDLELCRHCEAHDPRGNPHKVGLCGDGFRAMMEHSAKNIRKLNIHACRHIPQDAFEAVFSADKQYPQLQDMEISFCEQVTDFILNSIFRCCPNLKNLNVFGCMQASYLPHDKNRNLVLPFILKYRDPAQLDMAVIGYVTQQWLTEDM